jgi:hypothetical protein
VNSVFGIARFHHRDMIGFHPLNPYGLAQYVVLLAGILLIVLVVLDWIFPSGPRATQLGVENADRTIPQVIRGSILILMLGYIGLTGWDPGAYGFVPGRALFLLSAYMLLSIFFYPSELNSRLLIFVKSLLWIVTAIASYRLTLGGYLTAKRIWYLAGAIVIIACAYTIPFCLDAERRIGQNADVSVLLWCIPLLLLPRHRLWISSLVLGLASVAVFATVKRGAILALIVSGFVSSAISIRMSSRRHKVRKFVIIAVVIAAMTGGLLWQWDRIMYRMNKDFDSDIIGSGRGAYYPVIIKEWYNSGAFSFLFGKGFFTVPDILDSIYTIRRYAHSDWLEILHDMGVLGIVLFVYLHSRILLVVRDAIRERNPVAPVLAMGYCVFALKNIYSQCVVGDADTIYFALLLGYSSASTARRTL